ncbi:MAG TPA: GGDEF domain-containing protein [Vicinamibacterales bacterium]|jgi:diguanylate cyclase (GGDEF)-like protein|nr:GGDEF domain-containing protein [Vicinamibacterales bacterium]
MRLFGRNDVMLLGALAIALFIVFSGAIAHVLDYVREIEHSTGLQLIPALVILATVLIFHQLRERQEVHATALGAEESARQATARVAEMQRLVAFGQALARSLNDASIRDVAAAHIPLLVPGRGTWAMIRPGVGAITDGDGRDWVTLAAIGDSTVESREHAARRALGEADPVVGPSEEDVCFPMIFAGRPVGVLGVAPEPPLTDHQRNVLAAAAALLAVSLKNAELFREVHENSVRDALTGCFNRQHALEVMDGELRRARRSQLPLSLVMFDLDHFKSINDTHGHLSGDAVLAAIGTRMRAILRGSDLKCRYGGEEFLILLPDTPVSGACRVAEMLRADFEEHSVSWGNAKLRVTASFGVGPVHPGETDALAVMARADAALYRAKQSGRNCVRVAGELPALSAAQSVETV